MSLKLLNSDGTTVSQAKKVKLVGAIGQIVDPQKSKQIGWLTTGSILLIIAIFLSGLLLPKGANWLIVISLMIGYIALIGKLITGRWSGILINEVRK